MIRRSGGFRIEPDLEDDWPDLLRGLIKCCPTQWIVWEDASVLPAEPVAYGGSAFLKAELLEVWLAEGRPYPTNRLLRGMRDGLVLPLDAESIRAGNRGKGLALMVVHFVLAHPSLEHPVTRRFLPSGNAAWYFAHGGYNLESVWFEVYGKEAGHFMKAGGYELWSEYQGNDVASRVPEDRRPALYCQRRHHVPLGAMSASALTLFNVLPPSMGLRPSEQRVALHALLGRTDGQIAETLGLSAETVRKAWVGIFSAAERFVPALFHQVESSSQRGLEKRRHLLEYLRVHMEELRPW